VEDLRALHTLLRDSQASKHEAASLAERLRNTEAAAARVRVRAEREQKSAHLHYYRLLGVPSDAAAPAITKAYRQLALKHHPDKVCAPPLSLSPYSDELIANRTVWPRAADSRERRAERVREYREGWWRDS
jgi:hypothetical protein